MKFQKVVFVGLIIAAASLSAVDPPSLKVPKLNPIKKDFLAGSFLIHQAECATGVCVQDDKPAAVECSDCQTPRARVWFPRLRNVCHRLRFHRFRFTRSIALFPNAWWNNR